MDIILIQPKSFLGRSVSATTYVPLPQGLLTVATPLDLAGYTIHIIDQRTDENWETTLLSDLKTKPICVGVSVMTGPQIYWALKASEIVKNNSHVPVVWGGVHATLMAEQTLKNQHIDIVVREEGEETFKETVEALAAGRGLKGIKGITYKDGVNIISNESRPYIDLNKQPLPSYHLLDLKKYFILIKNQLCLPIESSRGCPFKCGFCYNNSFHHNKWRYFTPEYMLEHIDYVAKTYAIQGLSFTDDNFFSNPERSRRILEGIIRKHPEMVWGKGDIRLDTLDQLDNDYLKLIEKSNCINLVVGIESGSQKVADMIRKEIDLSRAGEINRRLANFKMALSYLFLTAIPDESIRDLGESASLMLQLVKENQRAGAQVQIFIPYPGTELCQRAFELGFKYPERLEDWIPLGWMNRKFDYPWLSSEQKNAIRMISFCSLFIGGSRTFHAWGKVSPLVSLISDIYSPIARRRMSGMHYKFLPELKTAEIMGYRGY